MTSTESITELLRRHLSCVSPTLRVFDYPAWYEARQKELEEVWPPRGVLPPWNPWSVY